MTSDMNFENGNVVCYRGVVDTVIGIIAQGEGNSDIRYNFDIENLKFKGVFCFKFSELILESETIIGSEEK